MALALKHHVNICSADYQRMEITDKQHPEFSSGLLAPVCLKTQSCIKFSCHASVCCFGQCSYFLWGSSKNLSHKKKIKDKPWKAGR